jgi:hypothetical protein
MRFFRLIPHCTTHLTITFIATTFSMTTPLRCSGPQDTGLEKPFDDFLMLEPMYVGSPIIGLAHDHGEDRRHISENPQVTYESIQYLMQQVAGMWKLYSY